MNRDRLHRHDPPIDEAPPFAEPIVEFYRSLPPVTRAWFTLSLATTGLHTLEVFHADRLILLWDRIPPPNLELWRILTSFSWAGPGTLVDFHVLLLLYSMAVVVPAYERDPHDARWIGGGGRRRRSRHRMSDCLLAFLVCSFLILLTYLLVTEAEVLEDVFDELQLPHPVLLPVFTRTLLYSIITLDSLKRPEVQHNINFFPVPGRYVPLFHVGFGVMMGYRINETVHGVAVGLLYHCLVEEEGWLASALGMKRAIFAPRWLMHLAGEDGMEGDTIEENVAHRGVRLEPGANFLHHAAAMGDATCIQTEIDRVESASSAADISVATAPFRQQDRNGWQPLHEAARAGELDVLKLLLEVDPIEDPLGGESRTWRRRAGKLKVNVNARTNDDRGFTALRLVEDNHGAEDRCAALLREVGGVSLGFGDEVDDQD
ncbi:hypothetical protein ACHAWF_004064 [Thalassiosira exigua]